MQNKTAFRFLFFSIAVLFAGLFFGLIGSIQYILPDFFSQSLSFLKTRPLHTHLVLTWIFSAAAGGIYYYVPFFTNKNWYSEKLIQVHFWLHVSITLIVIACYFTGNFGGREYMEYPPVISVLIIIGWILLLVNFIKTAGKEIQHGPVYLWMWLTGIVFFIFTYIESLLWLIPFFRDNIIRDITVQWKALGSMVGAWNMLTYGTAFFVMEKISGNTKTARAPLTFFFYFLGLTNLMFNWGHHTYIVPAQTWIKTVAYIISMTELLIVGNIIYNWRKTMSEARKNFHSLPYRFLSAADLWIFLNLILAITISVPAINYYTHGTFITVAHAMGATIGINSMIMFASCFCVAELNNNDEKFSSAKLKSGFWIINTSLAVFWCSLIGAGITKSMIMKVGETLQFYESMSSQMPFYYLILFSGTGIITGIILLGMPLLKKFASVS